jgi:hypothetical protein
MRFAAGITLSTCAITLFLYGKVTSIPSKFESDLRPRMQLSKFLGSAWSGIMTAFLLSARNFSLNTVGDFTCAIGSPTIP